MIRRQTGVNPDFGRSRTVDRTTFVHIRALATPASPNACHFGTNRTVFKQVYDERFQAEYGYWRPVVGRSVAAFLKCGDLQYGFARVRCPDCKHEMFVAYSCKQRCTCPSCHQKRTLLTAIHVAEEVCFPVAHR